MTCNIHASRRWERLYFSRLAYPLYLLYLVLYVNPALAQVAPIKIWEVDNVTQTDRVTIFGMVFKNGDIASCPVPMYNGVALDTSHYQSRVVTGYPINASAKSALVAIMHTNTAGQGKVYSFISGNCNSSGGLDQSGILSFMGSTHNAQIVVTANGQTVTLDAKAMVTSLTFADCKMERWFEGPLATVIKVQDCSPTTAYDFGWLYNGTTMGLNGGVPYSGTSKIASLHGIFYLVCIPSKNIMEVRFVLENQWTDRGQDQVFDFSLKVGAANTTMYTKSAFKLIWRTHFTNVYTSGTEQGHVRIGWNFDYLISTGQFPSYDRSALVTSNVDPSSNYTAWAASDRGDKGGHALMVQDYAANEEGSMIPMEWMRYLHLMDDASQGAGVVNGKAAKAYMILTGDKDNHPSNTLVGCVETVTGKGGGKGCGYANIIMNVPYHLREGRSTGSYHWSGLESKDATPANATGTTVSPVGRDLSRHAHPADTWAAGIYPTTSVGSITTFNNWDIGLLADHFLEYYFVSSALFGEQYYLDQLLNGAHALFTSQNPDSTGAFGNGMFGNQSISNGSVRSMAWMFDTAQYAVSLAIDGSIEKTHLTTQMNSNLQMLCGFMKLACPGITATTPNDTCSGYSGSTANRTDFGRCTLGQNVDPTGSHSLTTGFAPPDAGDSITYVKPANLAGNNGGATDSAEGFFDSQAKIVLHKGIDMGFTQFTAVAMESSKLEVRKVLDPAFNIYLAATEVGGMRQGPNVTRSGTAASTNAGTTLTRVAGDLFDAAWGSGTAIYILGSGRTISVGGSTSVVTLTAPACVDTSTAITGATNASPIVITATAHGISNGTSLWISGVLGNTAANGVFVAASVTANTLALTGSTGNGTYTSGGLVQTCANSTRQWSKSVGDANPTTAPYITDMATMLATYQAPYITQSSFSGIDFPCSADHSYSLLQYGHLSLAAAHGVTYGSYTGAAAFSAWQAIFPFFGGGMCGGSPGNIGDIQLKFALTPRSLPSVSSVSGGNLTSGGNVVKH